MTVKLLSILYPEEARDDEVELYIHRITTDDDQSVHEVAPYAFDLRGWPRASGGYAAQMNEMAKDDDCDRVEDIFNGLQRMYADRGQTVDLTREGSN